MDRKELEAIVIKAVATIYGKDESELSMDTNIKEELGGASVKMVGLTAAIEEETDAMVELQVASACETLGDLVDAVEDEL
ncbi:MAG TPA: acyl carrier protein [Lachnospiraceae bacterium]|nr:acyl carrier protein [Lachnospiraceae bacterium]HCG59701.1 acyl carrier protein [Lachnospiraceae bacterium]